MASIIAAAIPVIFQIIGWLIEKSNASKEQKESYLAFISAYNKMGNASKKQYDDINSQLDDFNEKDSTKH